MNYHCAHLRNVCIDQVNLEQLKVQDADDGKVKGVHRGSLRAYSRESDTSYHKWNCVKCGAGGSPWMCLSCGYIFCSRDENQDALKHYTLDPSHCIAIHCYDGSVHCYECDDYIYEDTDDKKIESVRKSLNLLCRQRAGDHIYSSMRYDQHMHDDETESESPVDEGTEEEEDTRHKPLSPRAHSPLIFVVDEDSGSVPEEETSIPMHAPRIPFRAPPATRLPPLVHVSSSAPQLGNLELSLMRGGHLLRARKRKRSPESPPSLSRASSTASLRSSKLDSDKRRGLVNLGNTCFMNSCLQSLLSIDWFHDFFCSLPLLEADYLELSNDSPSPRYNTRRASQTHLESPKQAQSTLFVEVLRQTLLEIVHSHKVNAYSPNAFFDAVWQLNPRFRGFQQQDAHEFLRTMLDKVHSELRKCRIPEDVEQRFARYCGNAPLGAAESAISRLFEGALLSQVTCLTCSSASNIQDPFLDLSLEMLVPSSRSGTVPLDDCIRRFFDKEELDHCEQYMCARCAERRPSTKQLFLKSVPNVLCLHLKRFRWLAHRGKLDFMVDFPLKGLDLGAYIAPNVKSSGVSNVFDLCSIIVHQGSGVSSGHYTAYGLHQGSWWHFNDDRVKASTETAVLKQKAYILFYTRRQHT